MAKVMLEQDFFNQPEVLRVLVERGGDAMIRIQRVMFATRSRETVSITRPELRALSMMLGTTPDTLLADVDFAIEVGLLAEDSTGVYSNTIREDVEHYEDVSNKRSKAAKKSWKARQKQPLIEDANAYANAEQMHCNAGKVRKGKERILDLEKKECAPGVFLTDIEHQKFLTDFGEPFVARCCEKLSAWIEQDPTPKRKRNGRNAAATFRAWVINAVAEEQSRADRTRSRNGPAPPAAERFAHIDAVFDQLSNEE